jgi:hypothetical protein
MASLIKRRCSGFVWRARGLTGVGFASSCRSLTGPFHQARRDFAATCVFYGGLPGELRLLRGKANEGPELRFVVGLLQGANSSQMGK